MLDTATLTGIFYGTDGTPVTGADVYVVPNQKYLASVGGAAWVPRSVSFRTDASGAVGTLDGEIFTPGIALGIGQHDIAVRKAGQSWSGVLTVDAAMAASATPTPLDAALQPAPPPELVSRADLAVGMAETAADEAAASAAAALAVEQLQKDYLRSSAAVGRVLAEQPDEPALVLDFARGGYAWGGREGVTDIGTFADAVTFTRASTALHWARDGILRPVAIGEPRLEYDRATGRALGLRVDPASTNRVLHSANISNAVWAGTTSFVLTPVASVIEGQTAYRAQNNGGSGFRNFTQPLGAATGNIETASFLIETGTAPSGRFGIRDLTVGEFIYAVNVDYTTLAVTPSAGTGYASARSLGTGPNGGKLIEITISGTTVAGNTVGLLFYPTGTSVNTDDAIIHHVQHENLPNATSPILTTTAAVTRAAETAFFSGNPAALGIGNEFTALVFGHHPRPTQPDGSGAAVSIGPFDERIVIGVRDLYDGSALRPFFQNRVGGGGPTSPDTLAPLPDTTNVRLALAGDITSISGAANGAIAWQASTFGARIAPVDVIMIGAFTNDTRRWGGNISRVVIWPRRLTDAQLQELTA